MPEVKFTKMHGLGNDYIYFDCIANPELIADPIATAIKLSDRHFSIGGDGIVLILKSKEADFQMRMFNADGSEAEMCGNAIRCVTKYLCDNNYVKTDNVSIKTGAGNLPITIHRDENKNFISATVDMGEPILNGKDIPVNIDKEPVLSEKISANNKTYNFTAVSMGNPHAVILLMKLLTITFTQMAKRWKSMNYFLTGSMLNL